MIARGKHRLADAIARLGLPQGVASTDPPCEPASATTPRPAVRQQQPVSPTALRRPASKRQQAEDRQTRAAADEAQWQQRQQERQRRANPDQTAVLQRVWPLEVVRMRTAILCDPSGVNVQRHLADAARRFSGAPVWAIVSAALGVRDSEELDNGQRLRLRVRRTWRDLRARRIVVLGLAYLYCSRSNKRSGQWTRTVRGFSISSFCALLKDPYAAEWEPKPSREAISGVRRDRGQLGYLRALEAAKFVYRTQLPAADVEAWEIGRKTGRAYNRYSIVGMARKVTMITRMRLEAWHRAGWAVATAVLTFDPLQPATAPP